MSLVGTHREFQEERPRYLRNNMCEPMRVTAPLTGIHMLLRPRQCQIFAEIPLKALGEIVYLLLAFVGDNKTNRTDICRHINEGLTELTPLSLASQGF